MIELANVTKHFQNVQAVRDICLNVGKGELVTLLGPIGSGKSTTLMMVAGHQTPDSGTIRIDGVDVTYLPPRQRDISKRRAPRRKTSVSGSSSNDPGWRSWTTVSSLMAYPSGVPTAIVIVSGDAENRKVRAHAELISTHAGAPRRAAGTVQDVTELRVLEDHVRQAQKTKSFKKCRRFCVRRWERRLQSIPRCRRACGIAGLTGG